ncbi:uncharacterized protein (TIGR00730 family) [Oikeobacillus pervagus]|uniref:Cytokinin riboside 5'-monophosphate phosphoribohydrolase n=1 Tax=Oikeobacillus pervagus TaxID=1325931 RepID=A0AAJ1WH61_9BACI|nr:TIGR00730 family Rossman fold protein [Oikeobacillus pervagus]MDQ0215867.1 uncharacterized protein (TIGR00730 family) [Oikeobacillus pervagus]
MKSICIFAGSSLGNKNEYKAAAIQTGKIMADQGIRLIYGGSKKGLMGEVANEVLMNGGEVIGVMPRGLSNGENVHGQLTELIAVDSMHERKAKMHNLADGFIALPGGLGTFEELFEVLCWSQIGIHQKPVGLLNSCGYYDPVLNIIQHSILEGFVNKIHQKIMNTSSDPEELIKMMSMYSPPNMELKWKTGE